MLTVDELKNELHYDEITGVFTRILRKRSDRFMTVAGAKDSKGHIQIRVKGKLYLAHRLAWLYMTGKLPEFQIDHRNRCRDDNAFYNLREATHAENTRNAKIRKDNTSGVKGVKWSSEAGKWVASCRVDKVNHHLGYFSSIEEAAYARNSFAFVAHREFFTEGTTDIKVRKPR